MLWFLGIIGIIFGGLILVKNKGKNEKMILIAGPCVIESKDLIFKVAEQLKILMKIQI